MSKSPALNGAGRRKCSSWIDSFVAHTANLEAAPLFRKWAAISAIAAVLEQKVFVSPGGHPLYPNLYCFLVGHAGIGKSRTIGSALQFLREIPEFHLGPTSMTMASLVDALVTAKRQIVQHEKVQSMVEFNSLYICADELSAFMNEYDTGLIAGLTTFFDVVPYSQNRRTNDIKIKIERPQLNILSGTTPSNLIRFVPEFAWEQGFTSRVVLIYSNERPLIDVFNSPKVVKPEDMIHDIKIINNLYGDMGWTTEFAQAMHNWKLLGFDPVPKHPKLEHYCSRRFTHLAKLAMVACVDRGSSLMLTVEDFNKAMGWLIEAEHTMPDIFTSGTSGADSKVMDEIAHYVKKKGQVSEHNLVNFIRMHVPANAVINVLKVMETGGMIKASAMDRLGMRIFTTMEGGRPTDLPPKSSTLQ